MRFEELSSPEVDRLDRDRTILILPLGSVEQHGKAGLIGTDALCAEAVARRAASRTGALLGRLGQSTRLQAPKGRGLYGRAESHVKNGLGASRAGTHPRGGPIWPINPDV